MAIYLLISQRQMKLPTSWSNAIGKAYGQIQQRILAMRSKTGGA